MPRKSKKPPSYYRRVIRGRDVAYLTLRDPATKKRRDFVLGPWGSDESVELYSRLLADWEAAGRRLPDGLGPRPPSNGLTVSQLCATFLEAIRAEYSPSEVWCFKSVLRLFCGLYGSSPADQIGPNALRLIRSEMIRGNADLDPPRRPWCRTHANSQTRRIVAIYRWAVAHELLAAAVHDALRTIEPLKAGRCNAREADRVKPVPLATVEKVLPHCGTQVAAMIRLQLLTGMRPGEACALRLMDLDRSHKVWVYRPARHKTAHHGHQRTIYLGPKAQEVIGPFLDRARSAHLFSPAEAEADCRAARSAARKTPLQYGNRPGTNRKEKPRRRPDTHYDVDSYRRAIIRACEKTFPPPKRLARRKKESRRAWHERLTQEQRQELRQWYKAHSWHPHQLRHTYATEVRRLYGLEAAQILLGHSSALVTEAVYAERDATKAMEIVAKMG